ncbi:MAG: hypothetical protein FJ086_05345 [Deltaproteobacteria bacterium]|nr:hypothetical protein [Deltaproteobacteria bacterium]
MPSPFAVVLSLVMAITALLLPVRVDDAWWHLRAGRELLARGELLTRNTFSFTAPDWPWFMHEWLSELLFAATLEKLGAWGLVLLAVTLFACTLALGWRVLVRWEDTGWAAALCAAFVAVLLLPAFSLRPWIFSNACFAAALLIAHADLQVRWRLAGMAALFSLWANLHGSFLAGLLALGALLGGAVFGQLAKRPDALGLRESGAMLGAAVAGCFVSPTPVDRFLHPLQYAAASLAGRQGHLRELLQQNLEWQPPSLASPFGWMLLGLGALCATVVLASRERPAWGHVLLASAFCAMAFASLRNIPLAALAACPLLGRHLPQAFRRWRKDGAPPRLPSSHLPVPLAVLLASGWALHGAMPTRAELARLSPEYFPSGLLEQLDLHRPQRPYNHFDYGGAIQWALWPHVQPFWDQRVDCFPPEVIRDGLTLHNAAPGWQQVLQRWQVDAVADRAGSALAQALRADGRWRVAWEDGDSVLFLPLER